MKKIELDLSVLRWSPKSEELIPPAASAGLSGASFYTIPDYYTGDRNEYVSGDGVLKVSQSGQPGESELQQLNFIRDTLGADYERVFVPTQLVDLGRNSNIKGLISPKFVTTVAEFMRRETPPSLLSTSTIFDNLSEILNILDSVQAPAIDNSFVQELSESLYFVANVLDTQIETQNGYKKLPNRLGQFADTLNQLIPKRMTLSANDSWLGNIAITNDKNKIKLFDPLPTLPMVRIDEFSNQLKEKNISSPDTRNVLIDYGRVSVNLKRFVLEWSNKGWTDEAKYLENVILPKFRQNGIEEIGEQSLLLGELINNAYFSICKCETCTNSGFLNLAYQELDRLINQLS